MLITHWLFCNYFWYRSISDYCSGNYLVQMKSKFKSDLSFWLCNKLTFDSATCDCLWFSARRGRIYLPQDELAQAGLSEEDILAGKVTNKWRNFMKKQIKRARDFFDQAEKGVIELSADSRLPVRILIRALSDSCVTY